LGIRAFEESFYLPVGMTGALFEKKSAPVAGMKEGALEDVFARRG